MSKGVIYKPKIVKKLGLIGVNNPLIYVRLRGDPNQRGGAGICNDVCSNKVLP